MHQHDNVISSNVHITSVACYTSKACNYYQHLSLAKKTKIIPDLKHIHSNIILKGHKELNSLKVIVSS